VYSVLKETEGADQRGKDHSHQAMAGTYREKCGKGTTKIRLNLRIEPQSEGRKKG